jgi:threonine dehydrogenase-like Zn-dependent dehydrogenase
MALHEAVRCCAGSYGRVVALGFYQGQGTHLRLGEEFHHSTFHSMGASSILAIDHRGTPAPGRAWDRIRVYRTIARLLGDGALAVGDLLTHMFPQSKAGEAFELIDQHAEGTIKVALTYD